MVKTTFSVVSLRKKKTKTIQREALEILEKLIEVVNSRKKQSSHHYILGTVF